MNQLAEAPAWMIEVCGRATAPEPPAAPPVEVDETQALRRALEYLERHAPEAVQGERNETAYRIACRLKDLGIGEQACVELMAEHWERCYPPLDFAELEAVAAHAYRYGRRPPGADTPEASFPDDPLPEPAEDGKRHPFEELNREHALVLVGGGHHILWETTDEDGRFRLEHLTEAAFHRYYAAYTMTVGEKTHPVTKLWMNWKGRRTYRGLCFRPGTDVPADFYNLWRGFSYEPVDYDEAEPAWVEALEAFKEHALQNVCQGDRALYRWLMGYLAHMVQRPAEKPLVALVLKGRKGTGKNALIERVGALFRPHFLVAADRRYLVGNFNAHMENLLCLTLDEAFWSGDKAAEGQLKNLITGSRHLIEHKGKEPYTVDNFTRVVIIGNEDWVVPASVDERRFAVFEVGDGRRQDRGFFETMRKRMEAGGYRLLLRYLLDYDLSGIDINAAPDTVGLREQKLESLEPLEQWWFDSLQEGAILGSDFADAWPQEMTPERMRAAFARYCRERNIRSRVPSEHSFGRQRRKWAPSMTRPRLRIDGRQVYVYRIPPLERAREDFECFVGHQIDWEE